MELHAARSRALPPAEGHWLLLEGTAIEAGPVARAAVRGLRGPARGAVAGEGCMSVVQLWANDPVAGAWPEEEKLREFVGLSGWPGPWQALPCSPGCPLC